MSRKEAGNSSLSGVRQNVHSSHVSTEKDGGKTFSLEQGNVDFMTNATDKTGYEETENMRSPKKKDQNGDDKANMDGKDICEDKNETDVFRSKESEIGYSHRWRSAPTCNMCGRKFRSLEKKESHETNHNKMRYKCACGFFFLNFPNFRSHLLSVHELNPKDTSVTQNSIIDDVANHTNKSVLKCHLCLRMFRQQELYEFHIANHEMMKYKCPEQGCQNVFFNLKPLRDHYRFTHSKSFAQVSTTEYLIHQKGQPKSGCVTREATNQTVAFYKCPVNQCGILYENFLELISHTVGYHGTRLTKEERKACRIDESALDQEATNDSSAGASQIHNRDKDSEPEDSLISDSKKQRNSKKNLPQCDLCKRKFLKNEKRDYHVLHHNEMNYRCPVHKCEQLFEIFVNLRQHCRDHHNLLLRLCEKEACKINKTQNDTAYIKRVTILEQDLEKSSLETDANNCEKELAESNTNTEDIHDDNGSVNSSLCGEEIISLDDDDYNDGDHNQTEDNFCERKKCEEESDPSVPLRDKSGNDDRNIVDDRADKNNFHLTADNNKQCDVNNIHKELDAQGSTSNLTLDDLSQVMTNSSLDNETAVNLNSQDELSGSSSQLSGSVFQNDVHSTQVVNKSRDGTVKPANLISVQKEKILKSDNKAGEIQLRRSSNSEHDSIESTVSEKRRRLCEPGLESATGNTTSNADWDALDTEDSEADKYFCKHVIISNLGKLSGERKSVAKLNIQAILHNTEFGASIELLDVSKVKNDDGRESSTAEVDNIFCMTTIIPVLERLSDERKSWAKVEIQRMLYDARFVG